MFLLRTSFAARVAVTLLVLATASQVAMGEDVPADGSRYAFRQAAVNGQLAEVAVAADVSLTVVCFLGTECPLARWYGPRLSKMADELSTRGVRFVAVDSNHQDSIAEIRGYQQEYLPSIPIVRDERNVIADRYGATRTPEVFVLDRELAVRYQGRVDDQYQPGVARPAATRSDLRAALEDLLADRPVRLARTEPVGCLIGRLPQPPTSSINGPAITFTKQISRVLHKHCVECHRPGEIGPFSLLDYHEVVGWAGTILETIDEGRMPPWHANPSVGRFANARHMPEADKQALRDWVRAGMPEGDADDLPDPPAFVDGWQLGRSPDLVVPMRDRPFQVPGQGTVEYQYFVADPQFTEDRWVTAAQVIPGSRDVVHHAIVFIRPPDGARFRGVGWLTAYVPGQRLSSLPAGYARKVPAGSKLVFQMHYTTNGTPRQDLSRVGIQFCAPSQVTHEVLTLIGLDQEFEIPPHVPRHEVAGEVRWLPPDGTLLSISPHMHFRGKSFQLFADRGGQTETLLDVPEYSFNWQHAYELREPLPLAGIDRLRFAATFDNSSENPFNPDPTQWVNWGDQSWEEMAVTFVEVAQPLQPPAASVGPPPASPESPLRAKRIDQFVAKFFDRLDTDGDGIVLRSEAPLSVRRISFAQFDLNADEQITRDEVRKLAETIH